MTRAQRVVHLIKATGIAGAERHILDLLPELRAHDWDAHLWVLAEPRKPVPEFLRAARELGIPTETLTIRGDCDIGLLIHLVRRFRRSRPSIVHTHLIHADCHGIAAARHARVPAVVTTRHNSDAFRRVFPVRMVNRWLWRRVDAGIAVSRSLERFSRDVEDARVPIRVIHHGIAPIRPASPSQARADLGMAPRTAVIGMVGRLTEQKGVTHGLQAFAAVAAAWPQAILLVAGDGPGRRKLERQAARLQLGKRVRFLGWQADSGPILSALDVLIAPSLWEGFGLVILEAMARGIPVLATKAGAIPEIVTDGETGLLVPPADPHALTKGLRLLLENPELRARLGAAGAERARRHFGISRMAEETLDFYRQILAARDSATGALVP